jgi:hypothetical protein
MRFERALVVLSLAAACRGRPDAPPLQRLLPGRARAEAEAPVVVSLSPAVQERLRALGYVQ